MRSWSPADTSSGPVPPRALTHRSLRAGVRALAARDPDLAGLARRYGPPPLWARRPGFATLIRIVLEQQVSLGSARAMYRRLSDHVGAVTPASLARLGTEGLRSIGFTRQKAGYCHALATAVEEGRLDLAAVARASDETGQAALLAQPGLGPWSVAIYYLMALRRPDVWPHGDLALADALKRVKRLRAVPDRARQDALTAPWAPWRAVAARLLWSHYLATPRRPQTGRAT